ncbi:TolC family protein [Breznakiella homolactica]|uniref:TolC family protein n=1 Tax=Breznakiella homolactica TaxID=2798577 RepID=A0A7T7XNV8_9SPIR|nr:TolC family protein [Breznakiella homolactica]QQO09758.1 TolC family protein [Breznakiella homolactica]
MTTTLRGAGRGLTRLPLLALLFSVFAFPVYGQEVQRMTPDEAVELAIRNNLGLESTRITTETKKRTSKYAWNSLVPTVDIGGTLGRLNSPSTGMTIGIDPVTGTVVPYSYEVPQWVLSGSVSVGLNINFGLFEAMRMLRLDYESGLISYEKAKSQLERDVRKSYYQILLLQENLDLMHENLATAQRRVEMADANYNAGLAPELTLLQARVAMENLKPAMDELENGIKTSIAAFAMNLGLPYGTEIDLIPAGEELDYVLLNTEELISKASSNKPDILELKQNLTLLQSRRKATFFQVYTPTLSLAWTADPAFQGDPLSDSWFMDDGWKQSSGMFRVTLAYRLSSLLPFTSEALGVKELDDTIRSLNISLAQAVRGTEVEIYSYVLQLEKSRGNIEALKLTENLAKQSYDLTEQAFEAGLNDYFEVQNAGLEQQKARLEVLKEKYNYIMGLIDLEYAMGVPFGTLSRS